jgi:GGDEF domain-containing protein
MVMQTMADMQKDMVVIFNDEVPIVTNNAFNSFFGVSSSEEYRSNFGSLVDSFVPHPLYFNKDKTDGVSWYDAIMKLDEIDRIVSMLTQDFDPCAFSVHIEKSVENYKIVTLVDITRDLIKRLMIQNNVNIDKKSGAYDKKYFLEILQNLEEAARFNEKKLGMILISVDETKEPDFSSNEKALRDFVENFKTFTRQDDMLVRWSGSQFLLIFLIDNVDNAQTVYSKLHSLVASGQILHSTLNYVVQNEAEEIKDLIKRVQL